METAAKIVEKFILNHRSLVAILLFTFVVRLPTLFEPLWYRDEAIYLTIGQRLLRGATMYADIFDHKTPGIYYLTAAALKIFGESVWSIKFLLLIWVLVTIVVFYFLGKRLFNKRVAVISTVFFSLLTSLPFIEGNLFNSEILMILPVSIAILLGLNKRYFLAGAFFSFAILLKVPAIFDFAAYFFFVGLAVKKDRVVETIRNLAALTFGLAVPIAISVVYFFAKNALPAYYQSAVLYNISYTGVGNQLIFANDLLFVKAIPIILLIGYFSIKVYERLRNSRPNKPNTREFIIIWLIFAFYGAVFGGRTYEHYLIQAIPAVSLVLAASFTERDFVKIGSFFLATIVFLSLAIGFRPWFNFSYYTNFSRFAAGQMPFDQYAASFDVETPKDYAVAAFLTGCEVFDQKGACLQTRTMPTDKLYLYSDHTAIYFLSGLAPASRYITFFHLIDSPEAKKPTYEQIKNASPKYIIADTRLSGSYESLEKLLSSRYNLFAFYDDLAIYKTRVPVTRN